MSSEKFLNPIRIEQAMKNKYLASCKVPAERTSRAYTRTDGRTDRETDIRKLNVTFQNFAIAQVMKLQKQIINKHSC